MNATHNHPRLTAIGTRVSHKTHGEGVVVSHDGYWDKDEFVHVARVGVEFDNHVLRVKPAYFWSDEFSVLGPQRA